MAGVNFCPYCDAGSHKMVLVESDMYYCKECDTFLSVGRVELRCPKCGKTRIRDSGYPMPDGEMVFQCDSCKRMFSAAEFLSFNRIKNG